MLRTIAITSALTLATLAADATAQRAATVRDRTPHRNIIELGGGRFQFTLDPEIGIEPPEWLDGAVEWEYAGQATYVRVGDRNRFRFRRETIVPTDDGPTDTLTRLLRTEMEDEHGRLFRVRNIDPQRLADAIDLYNAKVEADFGLEHPADCVEDGSATDPPPFDGDPVVPLGWDRIDQDNDGTNDLFLYNDDDRNLVDDPLTARQEKAVIYFFGDVGSDAGSCTGVLVGDEWVLTAAHCAKNAAGTAWIYAEDTNDFDGQDEARRGKVCTRGNYYSGAECANVIGRWGNGSYGGDGDMGDDIIVMKIDQPLGQGNYMALSQASNSTLKSNPAYNLGHPGLAPNGGNNIINCSPFPVGAPYGGYEDDPFAPCESKMYWAKDDVTYTSSKIIGTRVDMSSGHSGGPIFYYPNGVSPTASHYLTGIVSGHHDGLFENYNGGAKIKYHRDWVLSIID